jgi:hypothetical protein
MQITEVPAMLKCPATGRTYPVAIAVLVALDQDGITPEQIEEDLSDGVILELGPAAQVICNTPRAEWVDGEDCDGWWEVDLSPDGMMLTLSRADV